MLLSAHVHTQFSTVKRREEIDRQTDKQTEIEINKWANNFNRYIVNVYTHKLATNN